jgi:FKBP-type peptidyl-prolyl cis-trans isomerase FkpA
MKRSFVIALALSLVLALPLAAQATGAAPQADSSYALGMLMGGNIKAAGLELSYDDFLAGLKAVLEGSKPRLTDAQAQAAVQAAVDAAKTRKAGESAAAGQAFLAANKNKPGVKTLMDGLQYEVLVLGTGPSPRPPTRSPSITRAASSTGRSSTPPTPASSPPPSASMR